ncbi:two-component system copper resistance phosphate regulon response regulator CusR [Orbus hercynius]|uniref:Two-component system copper resistance phosphate regulon response regulator CusR n=1 Tax=Orbus hercynius TaxID=593135 RepID=A0A495RCT3_9GAMM|nr:heavy metal response regulator transcription factor [Orbus hercynius]RKS85287.1 two-component system copper resistance phosphate regulon response regulator CusR [Orbus hercynius]
MKLLIIEDNLKIADYLKKGLTESGYTIDLAHDGVDGLHYALSADYDLLILDIMLPKLDGLAILQAVRHANKEMPILLLSARDQVADRVNGLEMGADDYLVKPFDFSELLARIRTLLRRSLQHVSESSMMKIDDLELDSKKRYAMRAGRRIDLTAKEFSLLELLMYRQGEVLSRSLIASQVWDMNFDSDTNVIDVAMRRLRAKVDDDFAKKLLHTIRGMGYVLEDRG